MLVDIFVISIVFLCDFGWRCHCVFAISLYVFVMRYQFIWFRCVFIWFHCVFPNHHSGVLVLIKHPSTTQPTTHPLPTQNTHTEHTHRTHTHTEHTPRTRTHTQTPLEGSDFKPIFFQGILLRPGWNPLKTSALFWRQKDTQNTHTEHTWLGPSPG